MASNATSMSSKRYRVDCSHCNCGVSYSSMLASNSVLCFSNSLFIRLPTTSRSFDAPSGDGVGVPVGTDGGLGALVGTGLGDMGLLVGDKVGLVDSSVEMSWEM